MTAIEAARALVDHTDEMKAEGLRYPRTPHWQRAMGIVRALIAEHERALVVLRERYGHASLEDAERLTAPPTDDEHEALIALVNDARLRPGTGRTLPEVVADVILAAGFRRRGPITAAMVEVAEAVAFQFPDSAEYVTFEDWRLARMRAALEAAERAR